MQTADVAAGKRIVPTSTVRGTEPVDDRALTIVGPPSVSFRTLWQSMGRLVHYRDLLYTLTLHRLQVRYKQSLLGWLWAIVQPLSLMLMYMVIFRTIVRVDTGPTPYALFAYSALLVWTCFSTAVAAATNSLVSHFSLVTKVYFPREILPLTYVLASLVDLLAGGVVSSLLMLYFHVPLTVQALYLVPVVAVLLSFSLGVSLALSAVQVRYRDIGLAMPLLLQLWMFATPVVYPLHAVPAAWRGWYVLNPMVGIVEGFRQALLGLPLDFGPLAVAAAVTLIVLPVAYLYFKHVESTVADVL